MKREPLGHSWLGLPTYNFWKFCVLSSIDKIFQHQVAYWCANWAIWLCLSAKSIKAPTQIPWRGYLPIVKLTSPYCILRERYFWYFCFFFVIYLYNNYLYNFLAIIQKNSQELINQHWWLSWPTTWDNTYSWAILYAFPNARSYFIS